MHIRMAEIMTGIVLAFVLVQVGQWSVDKYENSMPAIDWMGVSVDTPVVKKGGNLVVRYKAVVRKQCPSDLVHFIIGPAPETAAPIRLDDSHGGYTKVTGGKITEIRVTINVPVQPTQPLTKYSPGQYIYRTIATRYCEEGTQIDTSIPDANFTLED